MDRTDLIDCLIEHSGATNLKNISNSKPEISNTLLLYEEKSSITVFLSYDCFGCSSIPRSAVPGFSATREYVSFHSGDLRWFRAMVRYFGCKHNLKEAFNNTFGHLITPPIISQVPQLTMLLANARHAQAKYATANYRTGKSIPRSRMPECDLFLGWNGFFIQSENTLETLAPASYLRRSLG